LQIVSSGQHLICDRLRLPVEDRLVTIRRTVQFSGARRASRPTFGNVRMIMAVLASFKNGGSFGSLHRPAASQRYVTAFEMSSYTKHELAV